jgi:dTDP-4-amino-4,6-dideoxygalactose transaminase
MVMFSLHQEKIDKRDKFVESLKASGIPAFRAYRPLYEIEAIYKDTGFNHNQEYWTEHCSNSKNIGASAIWLPHYILLNDEDEIIRTSLMIKDIYNNLYSNCNA